MLFIILHLACLSVKCLFPDTRFRSTAIRSVLTESSSLWPLLVEGQTTPTPAIPEIAKNSDFCTTPCHPENPPAGAF